MWVTHRQEKDQFSFIIVHHGHSVSYRYMVGVNIVNIKFSNLIVSQRLELNFKSI